MTKIRQQSTFWKQSLDEADDVAQYDAHAKNILANKELLARIFKETISETKDYSLEEIEQMIEGKPEIGLISLEPGLTNKPKKIHGEGTEDLVSGEGATYFDIITRLRIPEKEVIEIIVNIEAQKKYDPGYDIVTRGVYYAARLISSQRDREFAGSKYDDLKKVYSIWICFNTKRELRNTITEYRIKKEDLFGQTGDEERYDLLSVIFIRLGGVYTDYENKSLQRLLAALFSVNLSAEEKKIIISKEYDILMTREMETEVEAMCNLGYGVLEQGIEQGSRLKDDLFMAMKKDNRLDDYAKSVQNKKYYEQLLKEYGLLPNEQ